CMSYTTEERFASATAVFLGHVTKKVVQNDEQIVTFRVDLGLKRVSARTTLVVHAPVSKWGWTFTPGNDFVVFADGEMDALRSDLCGGTIDAKQAPKETEKLLTKLRALSQTTSAVSVPSGSVEPSAAPESTNTPPSPPPSTKPTGSGCTGCALAPTRAAAPE